MDATRFDQISKIFARRRLSRRQALTQGGAALVATGLATTGLAATAAAQATPDAGGDATPAAEPDAGAQVPAMLFVQAFQSGTIAPVEGVDGRYTVTLEHGLGRTIYFSDRPERIVGSTPTHQFLEGLPFSPDNPPNAALLVETGEGDDETDIAVVELYAPKYDPVNRGVVYEVAALAAWEDSMAMGLAEAPTDLAALAPRFGAAHLFIDDCPNSTIGCWLTNPLGDDLYKGEFDNQPMCWNYSVCIPCEPYGHDQPDKCATVHYWNNKCDQQFPECDGKCWSENQWPFSNDICSE